jgi:hypothetical protein
MYVVDNISIQINTVKQWYVKHIGQVKTLFIMNMHN